MIGLSSCWVGLVSGVPFILVVNAALPVRSVADLVTFSKSKAGGLDYASTGPGSAANLYAVLLKNALGGIEMTPIPYKGNAPGLQDVVAGHVSVMFSDLLSALPLIQTGKLRALGVSTAKRSAAAPDIPTLAEAGVPGYDASAWQMIVAPAKTASAVNNAVNVLAPASMGVAQGRLNNWGSGLLICRFFRGMQGRDKRLRVPGSQTADAGMSWTRAGRVTRTSQWGSRRAEWNLEQLLKARAGRVGFLGRRAAEDGRQQHGQQGKLGSSFRHIDTPPNAVHVHDELDRLLRLGNLKRVARSWRLVEDDQCAQR